MLGNQSIESGYTAYYYEKMPTWYQDEQGESIAFDWDQLAQERNAHRFLCDANTTPFYRYMVRYLTERFPEACAGKAKAMTLPGDDAQLARALADRLLEELEEAPPLSDLAQDLCRFYAELVMESFRQQDCCVGRQAVSSLSGETRPWSIAELQNVVFKKNIYDAHFFMLALGLDMSHADAELFLQKVLLRTGFNAWVPEEAFLSLCLRSGSSRKRALFQQLMAAFREVSPRPYRSEESRVTVQLQSLAQDLLDRHAGDLARGTEDPAVTAFLEQYRYLIQEHENQYRRHGNQTFCNLWETLEKELQPELEDYQGANMEPISMYAQGTVRIACRPGAELTIPKGTVFTATGSRVDPQWQASKRRRRAEQENLGKEVKAEKTEFIPSFPCRLISTAAVSGTPSARLIQQELPVRAAYPVTKDTCEIPKGSEFSCDAIPELEQIRFVNHSKLKADGKKFSDGNRYQSGNLFFTCDAGISIPAGTVFYCNGVPFQSLRAIEGSCYLDVPVICGEEEVQIAAHTVGLAEDSDLLRHPNVLGVDNDTISMPRAEDAAGSRLCAFLYRKATGANYLGADVPPQEYARLLHPILEGTQIRDDRLSNLKNKPALQPRRDEILTAAFLLYAARSQQQGSISKHPTESDRQWQETMARAENSARQWAENAQQHAASAKEHRDGKLPAQLLGKLSAAIGFMDQQLIRCGFHELYVANPYDRLLAYLSICEEPLNAFLNCWGLCLGFPAP